MKGEFQLDEIGYRSEVKLDIIKEYAVAYSRILSGQKSPALWHAYIDAFAGPGVHLSRTTQEFVPGSPKNTLNVKPPFREYHFIDIDAKKTAVYVDLRAPGKDVFVYEEDCNQVLSERVFPRVRYEDYRRGLCILDPYGLHLGWKVIEAAARMGSIDMFLNFPVADMNRNVLWHEPDRVPSDQAARMTSFWGDESWRQIAYARNLTIFGDEYLRKEPNRVVAEALRDRLKQVAGFKRVPEPVPMRNRKNAVVYYLFFASQKDTAENIVLDIFNKYRNRGVL